MPATVDRARLASLIERERARFGDAHPQSRALFARAGGSLLGGVPMPWMMRWAGGFPVFLAGAHGARLTDVDGHRYVDFCLGDTGAMPGHSATAFVQRATRQLERGVTTMLPTEDAIWAAEELSRRFGLDRWLFTLSATDANRAAIRIARQLTGRPKVLIYSYCYHGSVDESFAVRAADGSTVARAGNVGPPVDVSATTTAIEFNDLGQLEAALAREDIACVLAEPAMTNMGIVLPDDGYHDALRALTREHGTLLVIDETHTFSAGPGGCTARWGLEPDLLTIGKAIGSGIPSGALGLTADLAERVLAEPDADYEDTGGVGGTLAGNAFSSAAMRATLEHCLRAQDFAHTEPLAARFADGVRQACAAHDLPWSVTRLGCRAEYRFEPRPAPNGTVAHAASDPELERYLHLHALNRGVMITPFHNMALMSPFTTAGDVDCHTAVFTEALDDLFG